MEMRRKNWHWIVGRLKGQGGFTLIELSITVILLGIILSASVLSYYNILTVNTLNNAQRNMKAALQRAYNIALNENVKTTLKVYGKNGTYPNTYTYLRGDDLDTAPVNTWAYDPERPLPTMSSSSYEETPLGFYVFKPGGGTSGLEIQSNATIVFNPRGTTLQVEDAAGNPSSFTITLTYRGHSATVTVNSSGEVI